MRREKGSITLFVLIAMMFFIMALIGMFALASNRAKNEKALSKQVQDMYGAGDAAAIYGSYIGGEIGPIYTIDQLKKIKSGEHITINEEGGKVYTFATDTGYVLRNDLKIIIADFGQLNWDAVKKIIINLKNKFFWNEHIITVITASETFIYHNTSELSGVQVVEPEQKEFLYAYTGNVQEFTAPVTGKYKLQVWGASRWKIQWRNRN